MKRTLPSTRQAALWVGLPLALAAALALAFGLPRAQAWARAAQTPAPAAETAAAKCLTCHEMQQQVSQWHDSSHKDVRCLACHADPGVKGWWQSSLDFLRRRYVHSQGGVSEENISTTVPDSRCLRCHGEQMPYVMQDYRPPALRPDGSLDRSGPVQFVKLPLQPGHDRHLSRVAGMTCTSCHNQVGHRADTQKAYEEASHRTCDTCHQQRQVSLVADSSLTCTTCHLDLKPITPADHHQTWRQSHGSAALLDSLSCSPCHISRDLPAAQTVAATASGDSAPAPNRAAHTADWLRPQPAGPVGDACQDCHQTAMPHPASFMASHGRDYQADAARCARCHLTEGQGFDLTVHQDPATQVRAPQCLDCHIRSNPHPPEVTVTNVSALAPVRVQRHPAALPAADSCQTCHQGRTGVCAQCHQGPEWHPQNWTQTHGQKTWQKGIASCQTCHSSADACTRCHRDAGVSR